MIQGMCVHPGAVDIPMRVVLDFQGSMELELILLGPTSATAQGGMDWGNSLAGFFTRLRPTCCVRPWAVLSELLRPIGAFMDLSRVKNKLVGTHKAILTDLAEDCDETPRSSAETPEAETPSARSSPEATSKHQGGARDAD
jgi:hypothetical protein